MARTVNDGNRELVQIRILEAAQPVFCEKGFSDVTMTDLINAAGLSRGGYYFYFKSVGSVFRATVTRHRNRRFAEIRKAIEDDHNFYQILDSYLEKQKLRLLNMEESMLRALYEYLFTHQEERDAQFRNEQKNNILETVNAILQLGKRQNIISGDGLEQIAEHFMYTIEGLNVMAMLGGLTAEIVDAQLDILKQLLMNNRNLCCDCKPQQVK